MNNEYSKEDLKRYRDLAPRKKLEYLQQMNVFLAKAMPEKSKKAWEKLKQKGF
jgi:hypothetical protein